MQFIVFEPGIELFGQTFGFMVEGFRFMPSVGLRYLSQYGLAKPGPDGKPLFDLEGWYPQETALDAFKAVYTEVGANTIFEMGRQIGLKGPFPPHVSDIHSAMQWLDNGYHFFHRKNGKRMFDPATGEKLEGIGHYGYQRDGDWKIISVCPNPYPCEFDFGLVTGVAERFKRGSVVRHDEAAPCRKKDGDACTYVIAW